MLKSDKTQSSHKAIGDLFWGLPSLDRRLCTQLSDVGEWHCRFHLPAADVNARVHQALQAVSMEDFADRPVHTLSGGQKQRAAIAGVLAQRPKVRMLFFYCTEKFKVCPISFAHAVLGRIHWIAFSAQPTRAAGPMPDPSLPSSLG